MTATENAQRIVQDLLDRQGAATIAGNVDEMTGWCDLPCSIESLDGRAVLETSEEMRAICAAFVAELQAKRLTHMVRRCLEAKFKDPVTIWATYETRFIRDGHALAEDPYASFVVMRKRGEDWLFSEQQLAAAKDSPANVTLRDWERRRQRKTKDAS